jgi:hypothetical protein
MTNGPDDKPLSDGNQPAHQPQMTLEVLHEHVTWLTGQVSGLQTECAALRAEAGAAQMKVAQVHDELTLTKAELVRLKRAPDSLTADSSNSGKDEAKGADPPTFNGNPAELEGWVTACRLRFIGQPSKFGTEAKKVVFATTFMRGPPMAWFQPVVNTFAAGGDGVPPEEFQSFENFVGSLRRLYGDPDRERTSEAALAALKQTGSIADYISKFTTHSQYVKYNDAALMSAYYRNLHHTMKDALIPHQWKSLKALQDLTSRLDSRARERKLEKDWEIRSTPAANHPPSVPARRNDGTFLPTKSAFFPAARSNPTVATPKSPQTPTDGSTPMEIDSQRLSRLTPDERARCMREGRCFKCRLIGHDRRDCPQGLPFVAGLEVQYAENDDAQE